MPLRLRFLFAAAQTQHLRSLAARELLHEDFAPVRKTDPITICERFQAPLNHFTFSNIKLERLRSNPIDPN
jgi:hypothetical protein